MRSAGRLGRCAAERMQNPNDNSLAPAVVLIVDDDPAVRNSLKFSLEIEGFVVRTYASGRALLRDDDLPTCGCLVLDQVMPDMTGLDLLAALRSRAIALPAILITTHPAPALSLRAAAAGIGVVEKPLLGNALLEAIHCALGSGKLAVRPG
jgi:two-component system, LuxR family, response regulator FixJ